jgi:ABC-2 type transport system permease protein
VPKSSRRRAQRQKRKQFTRQGASQPQAPAASARNPRPARSKETATPPQPTLAAATRREVASLASSPVAWVVGAVFVFVVSGLGFAATAVAQRLLTIAGVYAVIANLLLLILAPLMTARFYADGRARGVNAGLGRWLGAFVAYIALLAVTLVYVVLLAIYAHGASVDLGLIAAAYLGLLLMGCGAVAVAGLASTLVRNQVAGFLVALGMLAFLWYGGYLLGFVTLPPLNVVFDYLGAYSHYQSFVLGQLSLRDSLFFLSVGALALLVATRLISMRRSRGWAAVAAVVVLLAAANFAASRGNQALDLTTSGVNTLAPQSVSAVKHLSGSLNVIGLFRPGAGNGQAEAEALIGLYVEQSPHVRYTRANWDADVTDVKQYRVLEPNTVVLDYGGRSALLSPRTQVERDFTIAVLRLESGHVPMVCWAVGSGGRDLKDANQSTGYSGVGNTLGANDFATRDLVIAQATSIPSDCDEVALVGAASALPPPSVKALDDYLAAGGRLLIACDPWQDPAVPQSLSAVLKPYGFGFSGALVIEPNPQSAFDVITPAVVRYGNSPITAEIAGVASFFPQTTAITGGADATAVAAAIGATSAASYAIDKARQDLKRQAGDGPGPFTIMETLQQGVGQKTMRIAIVGTAAFAENRVLPPNSNDANLELALGTFEWLAGSDLAPFSPKPRRAAVLPLSQQDQTLLIVITVGLMPGLMVAAALGLVWRRRRAG